MTVAIFVMDDILATGRSFTGLEGQRQLYGAFQAAYRMVVVTTHPDRERVKEFLRTEHYRYDLLINKEATVALDDVSWRVQSVRDVRAMGWPVALYLDCNPDAVQRVFADGTTALLLAHRLVRPQWLPDARQPKSWTDLVAFIDQQKDREADAEPSEPRPWEQSVVP